MNKNLTIEDLLAKEFSRVGEKNDILEVLSEACKRLNLKIAFDKDSILIAYKGKVIARDLNFFPLELGGRIALKARLERGSYYTVADELCGYCIDENYKGEDDKK